jgi:HEPN domain-containing protein
MRATPREEARRWFEEAANDLDTARYLAEGRRFNCTKSLAPHPGLT